MNTGLIDLETLTILSDDKRGDKLEITVYLWHNGDGEFYQTQEIALISADSKTILEIPSIQINGFKLTDFGYAINEMWQKAQKEYNADRL